MSTVPAQYIVLYCSAPGPSENIIEIDFSSVKRIVILEFKKMTENAYWVVNRTWKPLGIYLGWILYKSN